MNIRNVAFATKWNKTSIKMTDKTNDKHIKLLKPELKS